MRRRLLVFSHMGQYMGIILLAIIHVQNLRNEIILPQIRK